MRAGNICLANMPLLTILAKCCRVRLVCVALVCSYTKSIRDLADLPFEVLPNFPCATLLHS